MGISCKNRRLLSIVLGVIAILCLLVGAGIFSGSTAKAETPTAENRASIRGIDVTLNSGKLHIVTENLVKSYSDEIEGEKSKYAIFEYVLDKASTDSGSYEDRVLWGDGMTQNYGVMFGNAGEGHFNAEFLFSWADSAFVGSANEEKRVIVIINRDSANWKIYTIDASIEPVFAEADGALTVSNGTQRTEFNVSTGGTWRGYHGNTEVYDYPTLNSIVPYMTNVGFGFSRPGTEISGLKSYNERGEDLGIVFFEYPADFTVTNLDDHADDDYWMTGNPSDTRFVEPINYNYGYPLEGGHPPTTDFNGQVAVDGYCRTGFYAAGDGLFTSESFGYYNGTLNPVGGAVVFGRYAPYHHKSALEFGKVLDIDTVESVTMRAWGTQLYHGDPEGYITLNSHLLFNLESENCNLTGVDNDCINLRGFVPEQYTSENRPTDFIDITIPKAQLAKLADEEGKIKGFQFVMMDGNDYNDYFIIDSISVNYVQNTLTFDYGTGTSVKTGNSIVAPTLEELGAETDQTFIGWALDGKLYAAGETISDFTDGATAAMVALDFTMEDGASIRLTGNLDDSGIRFVSRIDTEGFNAYSDYITDFGTLIVKAETITPDNEFLIENYQDGVNMVKIESTKQYTESGYTCFNGALVKIKTENYAAEFAARGYLQITYTSGETAYFYTDVVERSIKNVAQMAKDDTEVYESLSAEFKAIIDAYIG